MKITTTYKRIDLTLKVECKTHSTERRLNERKRTTSYKLDIVLQITNPDLSGHRFVDRVTIAFVLPEFLAFYRDFLRTFQEEIQGIFRKEK